MVIVRYNILMVIFMKEILEMINYKDLEIIIIDIYIVHIKENGKQVDNQEKEFYNLEMDVRYKLNGIKDSLVE